MAYFNHAFKKSFLATGVTLNTNVSLLNGLTTPAATDGAVLDTGGLPTYILNDLAAQGRAANGNYFEGYIGFFDAKTNLSYSLGGLVDSNCCPIIIAGSAIYTNDKVGPFHGGYQETNKSKMINPKYISRIYDVSYCLPENEVVHVGSTFWTAGGGVLTATILVNGSGYALTGITTVTGGTGEGMLVSFTADGGGNILTITIINPGKGYTVADVVTLVGGGNDATLTINTVTDANGDANCCKEFLCGETYHLRLDVKGSPALRFLNHNAYFTADAYTGCCPAGSIAPTPVDSTEVMILWANAILRYPVVNPFVQILVQDETGVLWYAPGTSAADLAALGGDTWDNYVSPGHVEGTCAGMIFNGAYVDTKFGDCTFQISDFFEKEPVRLYLSETDLNGDPCTFEGICVVTECQGKQVMGLGEQALRDLILSESYRQNFVHSDFRIREITQGNQIVSSIDRNGLYGRYYIQHNVPRFNNPSSTFDNDQYLLELVSYEYNSGGAFIATGMVDAWGAVIAWVENCNSDCLYESYGCESTCAVPVVFPTQPTQVYPPATPQRG